MEFNNKHLDKKSRTFAFITFCPILVQVWKTFFKKEVLKGKVNCYFINGSPILYKKKHSIFKIELLSDKKKLNILGLQKDRSSDRLHTQKKNRLGSKFHFTLLMALPFPLHKQKQEAHVFCALYTLCFSFCASFN